VSVGTRLARLEGSLDPKPAVLLWLGEAHAFPSLAAYAAWLVEQPLSVAPLVRIPRLVEASVRRAMRGQKGDVVDPAISRAIMGAVFRIELVITLNTTAEATLRLDGARYSTLLWQARAMAAEDGGSTVGAGRTGRTIGDLRWTAWRKALAALIDRLSVAAEVRTRLEARYLDGHAALLPETAADVARLRPSAERLAAAGNGRPTARPHRRSSATAKGGSARLKRDALDRTASVVAARLVDEVRARTSDSLLDVAGAQEMAARVMAGAVPGTAPSGADAAAPAAAAR
jgi:hypothetical protein